MASIAIGNFYDWVKRHLPTRAFGNVRSMQETTRSIRREGAGQKAEPKNLHATLCECFVLLGVACSVR